MEKAKHLRITTVLVSLLLIFRALAWSTEAAGGWMLVVGWGAFSFFAVVYLITYGYHLWELRSEGNKLTEKQFYPFFVGVLGFMTSLLMEIPLAFGDPEH